LNVCDLLLHRNFIENRFVKSKEWIAKGEGILSGKEEKLSLDDTISFVKTGEKLLLFACPDVVQSLKEHIRKAKQWMAKLEKLDDQKTSSAGALEELLQEAKTFMIDVSSHIDSMVQVTQVYCLCRHPSHGVMVGCDLCGDWLHINCIGMTKAQVIVVYIHRIIK
jgi:hypothetical protein